MYAELDYRIHFEAILKWCSFSAYNGSSFVRVICFRLGADFFCAIKNIGGDVYGTDTSD